MENDNIKFLFKNAAMKNKSLDKKLKETSEKSLKTFIEQSILNEASSYEQESKQKSQIQ